MTCYIGDTKLKDLNFYNSIKGPNAPPSIAGPNPMPQTPYERALDFLRGVVDAFNPFKPPYP
jgi:hypothetical protein